MFQTAVSLDELNCELTSLIYTFECDILIENNTITIVKVGKTSRTLKERLLGYKELNIKNIHWIQVESINKVERELLEYLTKDLKLRIAKGKEFFHSDIETVKEAILYIINNQSIDVVNEQSDTEFQCENCLKFFKNKAGLSNHVKACIVKDNSITCKYCNNIFSTKGSLLIHYSTCKQKEIQEITDKYEKIINCQLETINNLKLELDTQQFLFENKLKNLENSKNEQISLLKDMISLSILNINTNKNDS